MSGFGADLRTALRNLRRRPAATALAIALLAIGLGGNVAVFGPLYTLLLRPLPFPNSGRLVRIGAPVFSVYTGAFPDRAALGALFSHIAAYRVNRATVAIRGRKTFLAVISTVTPDFFSVLGVRPWLGTGFPGDAPEATRSAVLSYSVWHSYAGADPNLGSLALTVNGVPYRVVGVTPPGFSFPSGVTLWTLLARGGVNPQGLEVIGLRRSGVPDSSAAKRLVALGAAAKPGVVGTGGPPLESLRTFLVGDRGPSLLLAAALAIVLLGLAGAGAANLLRAQMIARRWELALRSALGASPGRLAREWALQALALGLGGLAAGFALALAIGRGLRYFLPNGSLIGGVSAAGPSGVAGGVLALAAAVLAGAPTARRATRLNPAAHLRVESAAGPAANDGRLSHFELLAAAQVALALALAILGAAVLRTLSSSLGNNLGFEDRGVVEVSIAFPLLPQTVAAASGGEQRGLVSQAGPQELRALQLQAAHDAVVADRVREAIAGDPEVQAVGILVPPPFASDRGLAIIGGQRIVNSAPRGREVLGYLREADSAAFAVLKIPLLAGRLFTPADRAAAAAGFRAALRGSAGGELPAVVNQSLAGRLWPNENPLGRRVFALQPMRVVGVVGDVRESPADLRPRPTVYAPYGENPTLPPVFVVRLRHVAARAGFAARIGAGIAAASPGMVTPRIDGLADRVRAALAGITLAAALLVLFAALSALAGLLGVYVVAAEAAARRRREMALRLALGAGPGAAWRRAAWVALRGPVLLGVPAGLAVAWFLSRALAHWLAQLGSPNPALYIATSSVAVLCAGLAAALPMYRVVNQPLAPVLQRDA